LILFPVPSLKVVGMTLLSIALGGLGTTVCYHRMLLTRLSDQPLRRAILDLLGRLQWSGHPASWVAYHRLHHAVTDTPEDISSPKQGGFWWRIFAGSIKRSLPIKKRWAPELTGGIYKIWGWAETPVIVFSICVGLILGFGWMGFFWMGAIRLVYSLHMQCLVNSLTHLKKVEEGDSSMNVWWLGPFQLTAWGENWHEKPSLARRFGAPWPPLVSDRYRLVFHLDARSRWPGPFRQAPSRFVTGHGNASSQLV